MKSLPVVTNIENIFISLHLIIGSSCEENIPSGCCDTCRLYCSCLPTSDIKHPHPRLTHHHHPLPRDVLCVVAPSTRIIVINDMTAKYIEIFALVGERRWSHVSPTDRQRNRLYSPPNFYHILYYHYVSFRLLILSQNFSSTFQYHM